MNCASRLAALILALVVGPVTARAQPSTPKPVSDTTSVKAALDAPDAKPVSSAYAKLCAADMDGPLQTFYLKNAVQQSDANDIVTALRNAENPCTKIYLVANQAAIVMRASSEDLTLAAKLLADLDRRKKTYRLTYTVSDVDGTKLVDTQHYSMVVVSGQTTQLKQGSKIPVATGSYDSGAGAKPGPTGVQTQFTYLDIGMNFAVTLYDFANGVRLNTTVEQSSAAGVTSIAGVQEPIIRQTSLKSAAFLTTGKLLMLGSVDIPGTARHLDIGVEMEQLP